LNRVTGGVAHFDQAGGRDNAGAGVAEHVDIVVRSNNRHEFARKISLRK